MVKQTQYEKEYLRRKKKLREFYKKLPDMKRNQEIFYNIILENPAEKGSNEEEDVLSEDDF